MADRATGLRRRMGWGLTDQAVSSLTNFGISLVVAHETGPGLFGTFSIAFSVYILSMLACRSLITEPFAVRFAAAPPADQHGAARAVTGGAAAIGAGMGAALLAVAAVVGGPSGAIVAAMAVSLPGLLAQDAYRYVLLAAGRPRAAAANDAAWLATQVLLVAALAATGRAGPASLALAFGVGAAVAAGVGAAQSRVIPAPARAFGWVRAQRDLGFPLLAELLVVNGAPQAAIFAAAAAGGAAVAGSIRSAWLLFGPLTMAFSGLVLVGLPEGVRMRRRSGAELRRFVGRLGWAMPAAAVAWTLVALALPDSFGHSLLGSNWAGARAVIPAVGVMIAASGCTFAALVGLRSLAAARRSLRARAWSVPVTWVGAAAGAASGGAAGSAAGLAVGMSLDAFLAWTTLHRALEEEAPKSRFSGAAEPVELEPASSVGIVP